MKENDKTDNQKKGALWAANSIFISGILISVFLAFYYFLSHMPADLKINLKLFSSSWFGYIVFFITSAILFFLGLRLKDDVKVDLSKYLLAIAFSGYSIEFYLHFNLAKTYKKPVSSQFETVRELRQKGIDAYRDMGGKNAFWSDGLEAENGKIYPLGGISGKTTVLQAQSYGYHPIIKTDEHGFNNKKGFYNKDDVDIIVLGECTIEYNGSKDPYEENIGEQLRKLNYKALNLAKQGSEPLLYLATLKEYAETLRPKIVIFSIVFRDSFTAGVGQSNYRLPDIPTLKKYLYEDDFTQNLISRQTEIDHAIINHLYPRWEKIQIAKEKERERKWNDNLSPRLMDKSNLRAFLKLSILRSRLGIGFKSPLDNSVSPSSVINPSPPPSIDLLSSNSASPLSPDLILVIKKMQQLVSSWGGRLYGFYWPSIERYRSNNPSSSIMGQGTDENFEEAYLKLGIEVIDMKKEVFDVHPDPLSLYPGRVNGHFNGEAKRLMAKVIAKHLEDDEALLGNR